MKKGFTLIETLLYLAILSILVLVLSSFMYLTYNARVKASVIAEVEQQGSQTMSLITQNIRNSSGITDPIPGAIPQASLTVTEYTGANSPTIFNQSGNTLQMKEGVAAAVSITSNRVVVSSLSFQNLTRGSSPGTVQIKFTLTHVNPSNRGEYIYSKTFTSSASLRWP